MGTSSVSVSERHGARPFLWVALALLLGALAGALVEAGGYLPGQWAAVHELATPWALVGFFLARPFRGFPRAAATGAGVLLAAVLGNAACKLAFYAAGSSRFWVGDLAGFLLGAAVIGGVLGVAAAASRSSNGWICAFGWGVPVGIATAETIFLLSGHLRLYGETRAALLAAAAAVAVAVIAARSASVPKVIMTSVIVATFAFPILSSARHLVPGL